MASSSEIAFCRFGTRESTETGVIKVFIQLCGKPACEDDLQVLLNQLDVVYATKNKFVCPYDCRSIGAISPASVWTLASYLRKKDGDTRDRLLRCAIVLKTPTGRRLLHK